MYIKAAASGYGIVYGLRYWATIEDNKTYKVWLDTGVSVSIAKIHFTIE